MTFQQAIETCFRKYATFSGRAARPELWWFVLFLFLGNIVAGMLDSALLSGNATLLASLFSLATLLPGLAVSVRRLHDIGKSGWWLLLLLVPILGFLVLLWFYAQPGEPGENEYGLPPLRWSMPPDL